MVMMINASKKAETVFIVTTIHRTGEYFLSAGVARFTTNLCGNPLFISACAWDIFIRSALVEGDWDTRLPFAAHNRRMLAQV